MMVSSTTRTIPPENKVFIGNLSYFCTHDKLLRLCELYGQVRNVYICKSKENTPLYYGFVYFAAVESAQLTIRELNGQMFMGRRLRVNHGELKQNAPKPSSGIQLLISFLSDQAEIPISEFMLVTFLSKYGAIEDCVVKNHNLHNVNDASITSSMKSKQGGYGFVWFQDLSAAQQVVQEISNILVVMDKNVLVLLDIKFSKSTSSTIQTSKSKKEERFTAMSGPTSKLPLESNSHSSTSSVSVPTPSCMHPHQDNRIPTHSSLASSPASIATSSSASVSSPFIQIYPVSEPSTYGYLQSQHPNTPISSQDMTILPTSTSIPSPSPTIPCSTSPLFLPSGTTIPYPSAIYHNPNHNYHQFYRHPSLPVSYNQNHSHMVPMHLAQNHQPHTTMMVLHPSFHYLAPMAASSPFQTHYIPS